MKCPYCGGEASTIYCSYCDSEVPQKTTNESPINIIANNIVTDPDQARIQLMRRIRDVFIPSLNKVNELKDKITKAERQIKIKRKNVTFFYWTKYVYVPRKALYSILIMLAFAIFLIVMGFNKVALFMIMLLVLFVLGSSIYAIVRRNKVQVKRIEKAKMTRDIELSESSEELTSLRIQKDQLIQSEEYKLYEETIPVSYQSISGLNTLYDVIQRGKAISIKEAITYLEELEYRRKIQEIQQQQLQVQQEALRIEQEKKSQALEEERQKVKCPECKSTQIQSGQKGFGVGKAIVGGIALGPIGVAAGAIGSRKVQLICIKCGHRWSP